MAIERWFDKTVQVKRLQTVDDIDTYVVIGTVNCQIQPSDLSRRPRPNDQAIYKTHNMWCAITSNIKEGDTIIDGTKNYTVRGLGRRDIGLNPHIEIDLEEGRDDL